MKPVTLGTRYQDQIMPGPQELASAIGNEGVDVISSPAIIGHLEMACHHIIKPYFESGEASVGVGFSMRHVAPAFPGRPMDVAAELVAHDGRRFTFRVEAQQDGRSIMTGEHVRALIHLNRFLKAQRPDDV